MVRESATDVQYRRVEEATDFGGVNRRPDVGGNFWAVTEEWVKLKESINKTKQKIERQPALKIFHVLVAPEVLSWSVEGWTQQLNKDTEQRRMTYKRAGSHSEAHGKSLNLERMDTAWFAFLRYWQSYVDKSWDQKWRNLRIYTLRQFRWETLKAWASSLCHWDTFFHFFKVNK